MAQRVCTPGPTRALSDQCLGAFRPNPCKLAKSDPASLFEAQCDYAPIIHIPQTRGVKNVLEIQEEDHPLRVARKTFSNVVCPTSDEFDDEAISSL